MRVEIRTQKDVLVPEAPKGRQVQTRYNVVMVSKGHESILTGFLTPGTFVTGFLSDTQAKVRAKEVVDRMKEFLSAEGTLDAEAPAPIRVGSKRSRDNAFTETRRAVGAA